VESLVEFVLLLMIVITVAAVMLVVTEPACHDHASVVSQARQFGVHASVPSGCGEVVRAGVETFRYANTEEISMML
jgi:hypothetical protein